MRRDQSRRAQAGDRTQAQADHGDLGHLVRHQIEGGCFGQPAGQVGAAGGLDGLDGAAAAGALDQANDRHAELGGEFLRHLGLAFDGGVGRTAAEGKIVAGDDDRAAIHRASAEHAVAGDEAGDVAVRVVAGLAGDAADFLEAAGIEHVVDPFPHRQPAAGVLALDAVLAAEFAGERLALAQFGEFGFPADGGRSGAGSVCDWVTVSSAMRFLPVFFSRADTGR